MVTQDESDSTLLLPFFFLELPGRVSAVKVGGASDFDETADILAATDATSSKSQKSHSV